MLHHVAINIRLGAFMDNNFDDNFCRLYTYSNRSYDDLLMLLQNSIFCLSKTRFDMKNQYFEYELRRNKEFDRDSSDFLFWPFFIEVVQICDSFDSYVMELSRFMQFLRDNDIQVVASCDFEALLGQKTIF